MRANRLQFEADTALGMRTNSQNPGLCHYFDFGLYLVKYAFRSRKTLANLLSKQRVIIGKAYCENLEP
jgi:hypothetical protein